MEIREVFARNLRRHRQKRNCRKKRWRMRLASTEHMSAHLSARSMPPALIQWAKLARVLGIEPADLLDPHSE